MIFLVDNGSVRADAYRNLCEIAGKLSRAIGEKVVPASLLHANKIPSEELNGMEARILEPAIEKAYRSGERRFEILPLFFGPSNALAEYLPRRLKILGERCPGMEVRIVNPLFVSATDGGALLADILEDRIRAVLDAGGLSRCEVILVDHGSPSRKVTEVRNTLATLLSHRFADAGIKLSAASMERRPGEEYSFNEPLLERALLKQLSKQIVLALLFLSPGRHAGAEGDIERICRQAMTEDPALKISKTELIGSHPLLVDLLARRWRERNDVAWLKL